MSTYGIIADMHGNLEALQAALRVLDERRVDRIVCLGDVVGFNAESNECIALLQKRGIDSIAGNHDLIAIRRLSLRRCADRPAFTLRQTRKDVTAASRAYLAALPARLVLEDDVVLVHGGVDDVQEYVITEARVLANHALLVKQLPGVALCFFGHTHDPKVYELHNGGVSERPASGVVRLQGDGYSYFINPGSIDGSRKPAPRFAEFVIFDSTSRTVEFMAIPYDYESVERTATSGGYRMGPTDVRIYRVRRMMMRAASKLSRPFRRLLARKAQT